MSTTYAALADKVGRERSVIVLGYPQKRQYMAAPGLTVSKKELAFGCTSRRRPGGRWIATRRLSRP